MAIPSLLALVLQLPTAQESIFPIRPSVAAPVVAPQLPIPNFGEAPAIVEPMRIALSPVLDGRIEDEEWDPFATDGDGKTYFQWEPDALHVAARAVPGTEVVASFDLANDGWLRGKDNLEVRIGQDGTVKARILDATPIAGPVWNELPNFGISTKASVSPDTIEATITDPGIGLLPEKPGTKIGARIDVVPVGKVPSEPYLPRVCAPVTLGFSRAAGLPAGLEFEAENESTSVVPGQTAKLRFTFRGKNDLNLMRINLRSEGPARMATSLLEVPFPRFDRKGRAYVDYDTPVAPGGSIGYRLARGTLTSSDGVPSVMQVSYRIGQPVDAQLVFEKLPVNDTDRSVKRNYYLHSNSGRAVNGKVSIEVPAPLRVLNGNERSISLNGSRGRTRQGFELFVPGGAKGTYAIVFRFNIEGNEYAQTQYLTVN